MKLVDYDIKLPAEVWLTEEITKFVIDHPQNRFHLLDGSPIFERPLVGFARGTDPIFEQLKFEIIIGPFHMTPIEFLSLVARDSGEKFCPEDVSVVSFALPMSRLTRTSQRKEPLYPSIYAAHTRLFGNEFRNTLANHLVALLRQKGYLAAVPNPSPYFARARSPRYGRASNWSERHVAFAAGLGTFGLTDGLITEKGAAIRLGSIVANLPLVPTKRKYEKPYEYCLFFNEGGCMECIKRCPAQAISEKGHDKEACYQYGRVKMAEYVQRNYRIPSYGCPHCQTKVPCEAAIPVKQTG
ncbi:MAG: epoxyqueuosine reductase [Thermodesulfobacteriota bacterium]|jgi:epoxyqueuosine reductase QueG